MAFLSMENVKALYAELAEAGMDFRVRDPQGNVIAFVG